ncbi:hypothetical protein [Endozoicomonas sp.]|uniref:hypothetical protein n=1 Tax=Endozoicomonas sp. TaxID=1892382 RepID=UPI0028844674|nr:hypothetical protein [Endozoicomonas sp.]
MDKQQIPVRAPKDKVLSYILCLHQWISNNQLARYLKDPERSVQALRTFEESQQADLDPETLNQWCDTWLSENGWEQLQDNANRYHHRQKEGAKYKAEKDIHKCILGNSFDILWVSYSLVLFFSFF